MPRHPQAGPALAQAPPDGSRQHTHTQQKIVWFNPVTRQHSIMTTSACHATYALQTALLSVHPCWQGELLLAVACMLNTYRQQWVG
jgi:hypothetical protein